MQKVNRSKVATVGLLRSSVAGVFLVGCASAALGAPRNTPFAPGEGELGRGQICPATTFDAEGVDLLSWLCITEFQAHGGGAFLSRGNDIWGYTSPSGREYALMGFDGATAVVEITDPRAPVIVDIKPHASSPSLPSDIKTYNARAYVVTDGQGSGLQSFDLSNVDEGSIPEPNIYTGPFANRFTIAHNLAIDEVSGTAYIIAYGGGAGPRQGFMILDLAQDPITPPLLGQWHERPVHDMQVVTYDEGPYAGRQIAFVATSGSGFAVLDVTGGIVTPRALDLTYPRLAYCHQCWITPDKRFCFVNDELDEGGPSSPTTTTTVFDISDLDNVTYFGQFTSGSQSTDHNLMVRGTHVFEANYRSGLRVFDIADMTSTDRIQQIGYFDTYPGSDSPGFNGAWGVYAAFPSGNVIVSDIDRGLFVLDPVAAVAPAYEDATAAPIDDPATSRGVAWGDADGDGDVDLFVANEGSGDRLFRNDAGSFVDATPAALSAATPSYGAAWGDMDGDGDLDLYVALDGARNTLWRNDGGDLVDVAAPPVDDLADTRSVCWLDVDRDGDLDLFVSNRNDPSRVYLNDGLAFGDTWSLGPNSARGMGAAWADADRDGDPDLALARVGEPNLLFVNEGGGTFTETVVDGNVPGAVSVGVAWGDYDRDGDFDLFFANAGSEVTGGEPNTLLRNDDGAFADVTEVLELGSPSRTLGAAWADADRDGWLDLYISDVNDGLRLRTGVEGERFAAAPPANFREAGLVYGFALADVDGNGGLHVYAPNSTGPNHYYAHLGQDLNHWVAIALDGLGANTRGIGARVELWSAGAQQVREITAGTGYVSQHQDVAHFGLGLSSTIDSLVVLWPSGRRSTHTAVAVDQLVVLSEPTPIDDHPEPLPPGAVPRVTRLYAAVPNPFNPTTRLVFDLAQTSAARLSIYDAGGRIVRVLVQRAVMAAGRHDVSWDGRDAAGRNVASGTYFYRLAANGVRETRRVTLLR